ncbi:MAG: Beta-ketoacyl-[acyl-carrier-protein] synthase FabY [Porticoccaceae bacterium UBA1117]|nr:MAG: Beta-ketoacyl-[acyl-carrier-protein] synthase FabY [Porticoccaceae bacterium UBA1117]
MPHVLPVIVGFGGFNAAGRSSSHQAFRRMVLESLPINEQHDTIAGLACLMGLVSSQGEIYVDLNGTELTLAAAFEQYRDLVIEGTLVRRVEHFDSSNLPGHRKIDFSEQQSAVFTMAKRDLPKELPNDWQTSDLGDGRVEIITSGVDKHLVTVPYELAAKAAGQLPTGFDLTKHYNARFHPRGLQMALLGASDAIHSMGIPWEKVAAQVRPDEIGVYSSSVFGQVDDQGMGGLFQARLKGERTTAKQVALGLNSMPADFVNAYVLGSVGHTEATTGACASFLYSLQAAVRDLRSGRRRIAVVGNAEAPITPEIMEGFSNMGALGSDENLCKIDGTTMADWRRASRPFGENCGFTLSEATQYIVLMDDLLAIELGADIHGAVPEVFINADGIKKSISSPGVGNYISFSKAVAAAVGIVGIETVQERSFVHAHGSSTPANRVTESELISRVADAFDINDWPVTAVKSYVGHSIAAAGGDQLMSALGTFKYGIIPGIKTVTALAEDVYQKRLNFALNDNITTMKMEVAFINSKGFGGNNASAILLSADKTNEMLLKRYGDRFMDYIDPRETTRKSASDYAFQADRGNLAVIYRFGEELIDEQAVVITTTGMSIPGCSREIEFNTVNVWQDMQ